MAISRINGDGQDGAEHIPHPRDLSIILTLEDTLLGAASDAHSNVPESEREMWEESL